MSFRTLISQSGVKPPHSKKATKEDPYGTDLCCALSWSNASPWLAFSARMLQYMKRHGHLKPIESVFARPRETSRDVAVKCSPVIDLRGRPFASVRPSRPLRQARFDRLGKEVRQGFVILPVCASNSRQIFVSTNLLFVAFESVFRGGQARLQGHQVRHPSGQPPITATERMDQQGIR